MTNIINMSEKGKYVVSHGRSQKGTYDLYTENNILICKNIDYKNLNELLKQ
jgi:hypothetical protein